MKSNESSFRARLRGLDLFSGIGGISLALSPWVETVAYCEIEPYAQAVLLERMQAGDLDIAPIWDDVRTLNRAVLDAEIDIIFGGFPCQDISVAGDGAGMDGKRSGLFFEVARLISEYRPRFVFLENVPAICSRGGVEVIETLASLRYDARWGVLSAFDVGAPHLRERWWCLASDANRCGLRLGAKRLSRRRQRILCTEGEAKPAHDGQKESVAFTSREGLAKRERNGQREALTTTSGSDWGASPAAICGVAHGVPYRVDRIKSLGNSVVPQAAREAFVRLIGMKG